MRLTLNVLMAGALAGLVYVITKSPLAVLFGFMFFEISQLRGRIRDLEAGSPIGVSDLAQE